MPTPGLLGAYIGICPRRRSARSGYVSVGRYSENGVATAS